MNRWLLVGVWFVVGMAGAAEKPQFLVLDTRTTIAPGADQIGGDFIATSIAYELHRRFKACATELSSGDVRAMIGYERQRQLLGGDDSGLLAEIGDALGRKGLLVRSS
jgi:hypothetical protein